MKKILTVAVLILAMLAISLPMAVPAVADATSIIYVNATSGNDSYDGLAATYNGTDGPKATITAGISAVASGGTVQVAAGTYDEIVNITKPLTLLGAQANTDPVAGGRSGGESIILGGTGSGAGPDYKYNDININSSGVTVNGFEVSSSEVYGISTSSAASNNVTIEYNYVHSTSSGYVGIVTGMNATSATFTNYVISHNLVDVPNGAKAIGMSGSSAQYYDITISYNDLSCADHYGIFAGGSPSSYLINGMKIDNNYIHDCDSTFNLGNIEPDTATSFPAEFNDNIIDGSGGAIGIQDGTISGNTFKNGAYLDLWGTEYGFTRPSQDLTISNNDFLDEGTGQGIKVRSGVLADTVAVHYNNFWNGVTGGDILNNSVTGLLDATNNWWDSTSGPSGNNGSVVGPITTSPYITGLTYTGETAVLNSSPVTLEAAIANSDGSAMTDVPSCDVEFTVTDTTTNSLVGTYNVTTDTNGVAQYTTTGALPDGIYDVNATVTGGTLLGDCLKGSEAEEYVAVVSSYTGMVTGGGWIDSPAGAYYGGSVAGDPPGTIVVTPLDVGTDWSTADTRDDGYTKFVTGPGTPPLGIGSLEMGTTDSNDKAQLFNYDYKGIPLADIDDITYATYRDSTSTNPPAQYPSINIEVDYVGDGSSYTTLVWEPVYAYGQSYLKTDTWQTWDAMAPSQTGFGGGWWSTQTIPGLTAFSSYVSWDTILQNNPNAKIIGGIGFNIGSGWDDIFKGAVDDLGITINNKTTTYDFEPASPLAGKATFGFISKYQKGASVPTGDTEFEFQTGNLNFHSDSYDWLIVNQGGSNAQFKGEGTVNGTNGYDFMLWATDNSTHNSPDTFRIKIWQQDDGTVIYDNGAQQPIGGGNIVVHK